MPIKSIISLSFDDGHLDNYTTALPILKQYDLAATFNIAASYVLGDETARRNIRFEEPMTAQMVNKIAQSPNFEIAGHGDMHNYTREDMFAWKEKLKAIIGKSDAEPLYQTPHGGGMGFAVPGTAIDTKDKQILQQLIDYGITYTRVSIRYKSQAGFKTFLRKLSRVIPLPQLYAWAYADTTLTEADRGINLLPSVPVLKQTSFAQLKALIDLAISRGAHLIIMLHSIKQVPEHNWSFATSEFERLCTYLAQQKAQGSIDVLPTMDLYNIALR